MQASSLLTAITIAFSLSSVGALENLTFGNFAHSATFSVAQELGFFTHFGLNVIYAQIPNSTFAFEQLATGGYDVLSALIDNAVNLVLNSNESLTVLGQLDAGEMILAAVKTMVDHLKGPELVFASIPNITNAEELRGKTIIVDSPVSGYAYVLRKILNYFGLRLEQGDFAFQAVGATDIRFDDLVAGILPNGSTVFATILDYPSTSNIGELPITQQPNILARVSDFVLPYASEALIVSQSSLSDPIIRPKLVQLYAALLAANKYLADPNVAKVNIEAISTVLNVSTEVATSAYKAATAPLTGETSTIGGNFTVDRIGLLNVIDVRDQFGGFAALRAANPDFSFVDFLVPGIGNFIDYSVQVEAVSAQDSWTPTVS